MSREYKVAYGDTVTELEQTVAMLIQQGWSPIGGIAVSQAGAEYESNRYGTVQPMVWAQAMEASR